jgi:hypothetical protein
MQYDVDLVEADIRDLFFQQRCVRCHQLYIEGMTAGSWACGAHVGSVQGGRWSCCGTNIYSERTGVRGCVRVDHTQLAYPVPQTEPTAYPHSLFNFIKHNFEMHANANRAPGGDLDGSLFVRTVDTDSLHRAQFNDTYGPATPRFAL